MVLDVSARPQSWLSRRNFWILAVLFTPLITWNKRNTITTTPGYNFCRPRSCCCYLALAYLNILLVHKINYFL